MIVRYNPRAEADLHEIAEYTLNAWGDEQREKYIDFLEAVCEQVLPAQHKVLGVPYPPRAEEGVLRYLARRHWIYFKVGPDGLETLHIRHVSRDTW